MSQNQRRENDEHETEEPMTRVLFVRHGQTDWNTLGRIQGSSDTELNARGREQARHLARRLRTVPLHAVYTSDLTRCVQTARIVRGPRPLPLRLSPNLREVAYGEWEGHTREQLARSGYDDHLRRWNTGEAVGGPPGGESREQVDARAEQFLACIVPRHRGETVLVVSHGGTLRLMLARLMGDPIVGWGRVRQANTGLTKVVFPAGEQPRIAFVNDTRHLGE